jgi:TM2 domain-containing membrane protein YozV
MRYNQRAATVRKKYTAAAVLSFFIAGFGQVMKGDNKKGLKIMLWFYMGLPAIIVGTFLLNPYVFLMVMAVLVIFYPVFWIMNIIDAYSAQVGIRRHS